MAIPLIVFGFHTNQWHSNNSNCVEPNIHGRNRRSIKGPTIRGPGATQLDQYYTCFLTAQLTPSIDLNTL